MLTLSKKTYYALEAVLYIAYNAKVEPIAGNIVAEAQNLPTRYLEPMMQKLVRAGILRGVRGPLGGYMLGRERRTITLADICNVIAQESPLPTTNTNLGKAVIATTTRRLLDAWQSTLGTVTIAQLCEQAETLGVAPTTPTPNNFTI